MEIKILADAEAVAREAASFIAGKARAAVAARNRFVVAFSGGRTPWQMLRFLADEQVPWKNVHVVQVDERVAPKGDPDRNLTHLAKSLLEHTPLPAEQFYAMPVESPDLEAGNASDTLCHSAEDRRLAAGARPRSPGPRCRRPHRLTRTGGCSARRHRFGRRADGGLSREAADDLDLSDHQPFPASPLDGDRCGQI